ncbi:hypothetical protein GCM10009737_08560 [Nocardioides lentus]|uniref:Uncharacterized protein n=1 Tax=Nocardioides lentus TaxID=338077 RepID=A0ABP5ADL7_9ACTN
MAVILPAHVWYYRDQSITDPRPPLPGLLTEWRQVDGRKGPRWEGLVTFARGGDGHPITVETTWIRAGMLKPAYSRPEPVDGRG